MAQLVKGTTFTTGMVVTASNLNNIVDGAQLAPGAITEQTAASVVNTTDSLLINQSGSLKQATVSQLVGGLGGYVKTDGSVSMTGNLNITATPSAGTHAATVSWVQGYVSAGTLGYTPVNKAGDTGIGSLTMAGTLTLSGDPSSDLMAAPRQYVLSTVATKANASDLTAHTSRTDNPHAVTKSQVGLGNVDNTSDTAKPVSTATQTALNGKLNLSGGTMTGEIVLSSSTPSSANVAASKGYVDTQVSSVSGAYVPLAGGTMTGDLTMGSGLKVNSSYTPTVSEPNVLVNKSYVDNSILATSAIQAYAMFGYVNLTSLSYSKSGTTVTVTSTLNPRVGSLIEIKSATAVGLNGIQTVTGATGSNFTFETNASATTGTLAVGVVTYNSYNITGITSSAANTFTMYFNNTTYITNTFYGVLGTGVASGNVGLTAFPTTRNAGNCVFMTSTSSPQYCTIAILPF